MHLEPGQWVGGELRIVRPLAAGGMGSVYIAEQRGTGRLRAVKTLHPAIVHDAAAVERFVREARVGASIESEHVVEVVAAGVDAPTGIPFIAMEYLEGDTLDAHVAAHGPMSHADILLLFRQLAHALGAAHRVGIIHRDLKPQNILLVHARRGDTPFTAKILDFGIAKLVEAAGTSGNSQVIGSPPWMAPEQLDAGSAITPATDVWSLGLIAFYLLTGCIYWRSASASVPALVAEIVLSPIEPASRRAHELGSPVHVSPDFDGFFAQSVARAPADRFAGPLPMLAALESALGAETSTVAPTVGARSQPRVVASSSGPASGSQPSSTPAIRPVARRQTTLFRSVIVATLVIGLPLALVVAVGAIRFIGQLQDDAPNGDEAVSVGAIDRLLPVGARSCQQLAACCDAYNARRMFPADCSARPAGSEPDDGRRCDERLVTLRARLASLGRTPLAECGP